MTVLADPRSSLGEIRSARQQFEQIESRGVGGRRDGQIQGEEVLAAFRLPAEYPHGFFQLRTHHESTLRFGIVCVADLTDLAASVGPILSQGRRFPNRFRFGA